MKRQTTALMMAAALLCSGAQAQLLPGAVSQLPGQVVGGVLSPLRGTPQTVGGIVDTLGLRTVDALDRVSLRDLRRARLEALIRANRDVLEADADGNPVRRGEIIAIDASPALLDQVRAAGFPVLRESGLHDLGIRIHVLGVPKGDTVREALKRLSRLVPDGQFEMNHVFEPAGGALIAVSKAMAASALPAARPIGIIDGGVAAHPALSHARITQRGFVQGAPQASGHGTAIASLLVGKDGAFRGAAVGRSLLAADVYGGNPASGSAEAISRAFGWLAASGAEVVNISLVGPPNRLLARAVEVSRQRGITIVAAVGNDGSAAPAMYPASYPGVIAVTGVDARNKALVEAGRAGHLDFAAPGADMVAALPGEGYAKVRGTSFAAPLVAARFAAASGSSDARERIVGAEAVPGRGKVGRGIVCKPCRNAPGDVLVKK